MFGQPEDRAIVRGVIEIAHSLGKTVTADGVETVEQVDLLRHMKCDLLQG
ncbi:MAG TPA: EAL domain-containing protein [Xanthobacteraceae bacterium]|nr:EAL domain-containing protein [Xanthobacteraceae bacterium]